MEGGAVSPVTVALHLYGRLPAPLFKAPHTILEWQLRDFVSWSEEACPEEMFAALSSCVKHVRGLAERGRGSGASEKQREQALELCSLLEGFLDIGLVGHDGDGEGSSA